MTEEERLAQEQAEKEKGGDGFNQDEFMQASGGTPPADGSEITDPPGSEQKKPEEKPEVKTPATIIDVFENRMKASIEDYAVPEAIKTTIAEKGMTDEVLDYLAKEVLEHAQFGEDETNDRFVRSYLNASRQEGFDHNQWLKAQNDQSTMMEKPADEFLISFYKQKKEQDGLNITDEQILEKVNKMDPVDREIQATDIRNQMKQSVAQAQEKNLEKELTSVKKTRTEIIDDYIKVVSNKNVIGGFPFSESDRDAFVTELPGFTEPKIMDTPNGGKVILSEADILFQKIMSHPKESMNLLSFLWLKKHGKLEGHFSDAVEKNKEKVVDKLDNEPQIRPGQTAGKEFDQDAYINSTKSN